MTAAVDRTKVERQRRYRQRIMATVRAARRPHGPAHIAEICGPDAVQDADVAAIVAQFVSTIRPAVFDTLRQLRRVEPDQTAVASHAAVAIGALIGIEPDPVQGATWADLHSRIAEAGVEHQDVVRLVGHDLAGRLPGTREFGEATIALDSAYDLQPLLARLGMWHRAEPTQ